jgi:hypothetical protein
MQKIVFIRYKQCNLASISFELSLINLMHLPIHSLENIEWYYFVNSRGVKNI